MKWTFDGSGGYRCSRGSARSTAILSASALMLLAFSGSGVAQGMGFNPGQQAVHDRNLAHRGIGLGWAWGELFYGRSYTSSLEVTNDCIAPRPVHAYVGSGISPYLSIAEVTMVPAKTVAFKVPITITTPPEPDIVVPPGGYSFDATPWVDIGARPVNRIVLQHDADQECRSEDKLYDVSGHIHVDPNPAGPDPETDACAAIWNSGNPLPGYDLENCTERFHELLLHFRHSVLEPEIEADPAGWAWFPAPEGIATMSAEEALATKKKAMRQYAEGATSG